MTLSSFLAPSPTSRLASLLRKGQFDEALIYAGQFGLDVQVIIRFSLAVLAVLFACVCRACRPVHLVQNPLSAMCNFLNTFPIMSP